MRRLLSVMCVTACSACMPCQQQLYTAYGQRKRCLNAHKAALEHTLSDWLGGAESRRFYHLVEQTLSSIIRSSSMVENTNSRLRRFFDSARGQINQARLNLIRFYLNHKPFERGRRRGKTAAQLFHRDEASSEHWFVHFTSENGSKNCDCVT